jgi:trehalose synthase
VRAVRIDPVPLEHLAGLLPPARSERLRAYAEVARARLAGRVLWNVSATATGGGVAEMLRALLGYATGAGIDARWLVLDGSPDFFRVTKRLHNLLHGFAGDGGRLGDADRRTYDEVMDAQLEQLRELVRPGDFVLLHDPQTAGLTAGVRGLGAHPLWRCHIGRDEPNELTDLAWGFLRPYLASADAQIFSRREYAPAWVDPDRLCVIPPSLDPFAMKNVEIGPEAVNAILARSGLADLEGTGDPPVFGRRSGASLTVHRHEGIFVAGPPIPAEARVVLQVSRWDRLKDMAGVARGFVEHIGMFPADAHLVLAGPEVSGVSDDPEGADVLAGCTELWRSLPDSTRSRVSLACLPMSDTDENALLVNALQRYATVVVQKSLFEGFGLTVTEPMWKSRPVVASRRGGIQDQIEHGISGLLLDDPTDLSAYAAAVRSLLDDPAEAGRLGTGARNRVSDMYLADRHLTQYVDLFGRLD